MMKIVILRWKNGILTMLFQDEKVLELLYEAKEELSVGDIVIGRVKDIVRNINAAFIETSPSNTCYLSLEDVVHPTYVNRSCKTDKTLVQGDEILVQVMKSKIKTKDAVVTTNLSFTGKYAVLTTGNQKLGVSMKLPAKDRKRLKEQFSGCVPEDCGIVIRTNAADVTDEIISQEIEELIAQKDQLLTHAGHRTCYSVVKQAPSRYLQLVRDMGTERTAEIITDDPEIYQILKTYVDTTSEIECAHQVKLYQDSMLPLYKAYSVESRIEIALSERVWLKSGGYLVIEPTEAMTVIDVNTGKYAGHKNSQDTFLKINLEAAEEIAAQLRLRNISGIIIVDFINMESSENRTQLMDVLQSFVKKDRIKTDVLDMTELQLVEMTRKKVERSIYECFGSSSKKQEKNQINN